MITLPANSTDEEIVGYIYTWVTKLEAEDYGGAVAMAEHDPSWTPELLRRIIKSYGNALPTQRGNA